MKFTYKAYVEMINLLRENGYEFSDYKSDGKYDKCVILRHDIDTSLDKALEMAQIEYENNVKSTYFALLSTSFYNMAERNSRDKLLRIRNLGHDVGLHFDELNYTDDIDVEDKIIQEAEIMSELLGFKVDSVSMHRPSKKTLNADYSLRGQLINSYGQRFFKGYKYVSDSRRRWREDVTSIIQSNEYSKLHILTHAFWYNEKEKTIEESIRAFVTNATIDRYNSLAENITDLESIISKPIL